MKWHDQSPKFKVMDWGKWWKSSTERVTNLPSHFCGNLAKCFCSKKQISRTYHLLPMLMWQQLCLYLCENAMLYIAGGPGGFGGPGGMGGAGGAGGASQPPPSAGADLGVD